MMINRNGWLSLKKNSFASAKCQQMLHFYAHKSHDLFSCSNVVLFSLLCRLKFSLVQQLIRRLQCINHVPSFYIRAYTLMCSIMRYLYAGPAFDVENMLWIYKHWWCALRLNCDPSFIVLPITACRIWFDCSRS